MTDMPYTARYPRAVIRSAKAYAEHLAGTKGLSAGGRCAADGLIETLDAAVTDAVELRPDDVKATWRQLAAAEVSDAEALVNHWQLGYGSDSAAVISIGTEHAYELMPKLRDNTPVDVGLAEMTMECLVAVIWLTGSKPDVLQRIASAPWWGWATGFSAKRPYHIYTADYHKVSGRSTWATIGRDVLRGGADWRTALAERCYQVELSAYPARQSVGGRGPSEDRIRFLQFLLGETRPTARVLIFHGTPKFADLDPREALAAAFLGLEHLGAPTQVGRDSGRREWRVFDSGQRRAIFSRALSGLNVSTEYLEQISRLVAEADPPDHPAPQRSDGGEG